MRQRAAVEESVALFIFEFKFQCSLAYTASNWPKLVLSHTSHMVYDHTYLLYSTVLYGKLLRVDHHWPTSSTNIYSIQFNPLLVGGNRFLCV